MKYPRRQALPIATMLRDLLAPDCSRITIAGSIRRRAAQVSDIEILYVPLTGPADGDLFGECGLINLTDRALAAMLHMGLISKRLTTQGHKTWGKKNKLAILTSSGIPVDFFATAEDCWWNSLVCRTGPAESNIRIAAAAKARGYQWNPYGPGFTRLLDGLQFSMPSEAAVFDFVGLPYLEPHLR